MLINIYQNYGRVLFIINYILGYKLLDWVTLGNFSTFSTRYAGTKHAYVLI